MRTAVSRISYARGPRPAAPFVFDSFGSQRTSSSQRATRPPLPTKPPCQAHHATSHRRTTTLPRLAVGRHRLSSHDKAQAAQATYMYNPPAWSLRRGRELKCVIVDSLRPSKRTSRLRGSSGVVWSSGMNRFHRMLPGSFMKTSFSLG